MNILIVSATHFEVKPLLDFLEIDKPALGLNKPNSDFTKNNSTVLITGVGMVNTALMMGRYCTNNFDLILNVGICGAFDKNIELGQLVNVTEDILSELGAEDDTEFLTYDKLNLDGINSYKNSNPNFSEITNNLIKVKGITVNTVHGNDDSIEKVKKIYNPDVESMEGAAFFASCEGINKNYIQIRAISNYVEKRDKSKWQMALAIKNLNEFLIKFIKNE